jgi:hypothetical protein
MLEEYNADDEEMVKKATKAAEKARFLRDETIRNLMNSKDGRAWINYILESFDMFGNPIVSGDPYGTYNNIGLANAGKLIWMEIEAVVPEALVLMRKEARENEKRSDAA